MNVNFRRMIRRWRYWLRHRERNELLREEMEFHVDAMARELMEQGMPEQDALSAARRKFGNLTQKSEESRSTWISAWISDGVQDLRHAFRTLRRDTGFTVFAILILGLGIGGSCTIFSVINALLLRPLPFADPNRLVWIWNNDRDSEGLSGETVPTGHFAALRGQNRSFSDVAAYFAFYGVGDSKLTGDGQAAERLSGIAVSQNFFSVLGVQPRLGRTFNSDECTAKWGDPKAVLLSYGLWKRRFASDPGVVGRLVTLNDSPVTIVGVLPASFDFATVFAPGSRIDLYFTLPLTEEIPCRWSDA